MKGYEVTRRKRRNVAALKTPRRTRPKKTKRCVDCIQKDIELILLRSQVMAVPAVWPGYPLLTTTMTTSAGAGYTLINTGTTSGSHIHTNLTTTPGITLPVPGTTYSITTTSTE